MSKNKKTKVIIIEPHPDDALGSTSGICFSSKVETIILTITKTNYIKNDFRDKIKLDKINTNDVMFRNFNVVEHIHAGFDDLHWDERIQNPVEKHDQLISLYTELYGENNYNRLCATLKKIFISRKVNDNIDDIYIAIPLGIMHPMHILTTSASLEAVISCNIDLKNIFFYVDHPYDLFDMYMNQSLLAKEYISCKLSMNLEHVDDVSVNTVKIGNIVKRIYGDKHYGEFDGSFYKTMCSYLIDKEQEKKIAKFLNIRKNNILLVATEAFPIYKTGGLGEVIYQFSKVLSKSVNNFCIVLPKDGEIHISSGLKYLYKKSFIYQYADGKNESMILEKYEYEGIMLYVVDVGQDKDEGEMYAVFCDAILQKIIYMIDFMPNILHCNDWQTGLIPLLHKYKYANLYPYNNMRTIYTIHASCYKGVLLKEKIMNILGINKDNCRLCTYCSNNCKLKQIDLLTEKEAAELNIQPTLFSMQKTGVHFADIVTTVSKGHAEELQKLPEFSSVLINGIRNGIHNQRYLFPKESEFVNIDEKVIKSYDLELKNIKKQLIKTYKKHNKSALQKICGFSQDNKKLFICMVGRLTDVKGFDYLRHIFDDLIKLEIQLLVVGDEDPCNPMYKTFLENKSKQYPEIFAYKKFDRQSEFEAYAGADVILMPSIKESCGIAQMHAMIHGTIPIVSNLSCFKDTIVQYGMTQNANKGIGFYSLPDSWSFLEVINNVIRIYQQDEDEWLEMVTSCFLTDFSWNNGILKEYLTLYNSLI